MAFCGQQSFTDLSFQSTTQADTQRILLGYAYAVAKGEISKSGTAVGLKSVQLYLLAASSFATDANPPLRDPRNHYDACGNRLGDTFFQAFLVYTTSDQKDPDAVHLYRCPVRTVVRIISRWFFLGKPRLFPVFCYQAKKGKEPRILLADKLSKFLKQCATSVYPDTSHLYRKRIKDIRTHSIRVTACMFLHRAGFSPTFIEHRLRWASDAWKVYLREDFQDIDVASAKVFKAALPTEDTHSDPPDLIYDNVEDDGL